MLSKFERGGGKKTEKKSVLEGKLESMNYKGLKKEGILINFTSG